MTDDDASDLDRYDAWFTPGPVAEQGLWAARRLAGVRSRRVLDLGAGAGVLLQRASRVFPHAHRTAVEIRRSEARYLRRHAHEVLIGDMFDLRRELARRGPQLVISNPPYTFALEALELALEIVAVGGHVLFLVRSTFGSAARAYELLRQKHPAHYEFSVAGRPNMRTGVSAAGHKFAGDFSPHTWLLFRRDRQGGWRRHLLPPLAAADLRWTVRPGTESHVPAFSPEYLP